MSCPSHNRKKGMILFIAQKAKNKLQYLTRISCNLSVFEAKSKTQHAQALGVLFVCFISCFTHSPRRFVLFDGMEESTLRRFSGLKPDRHLSVTGHRICSAACVLYYDIHHMAACH